MSEFRRRGLKVVVDTTETAEFDFALNSVSDTEREQIARNLKQLLRSEYDRVEGLLRIREVIAGWEVVFSHYTDNNNYVVLIIGYGKKGEMEPTLKLLARATLEQYAPGVKVLLKGKEAK